MRIEIGGTVAVDDIVVAAAEDRIRTVATGNRVDAPRTVDLVAAAQTLDGVGSRGPSRLSVAFVPTMSVTARTPETARCPARPPPAMVAQIPWIVLAGSTILHCQRSAGQCSSKLWHGRSSKER
jgi:hypothetical protein